MPLPTPYSSGFNPYPVTPPAPPAPPPSAPPSYYQPSNPAYTPSYNPAYSAPQEAAPASDPQQDYGQQYEPFYAHEGFYEGWNPMNLSPNFFAQGTGPTQGQGYDYGGQDWGAPPPWWGAAPAAPVVPKPVRPKAPLNLAIPGTSPFLEFSDQTLGYGTTQAQQGLGQFLGQKGFQGTGNVGQYGERTYKRQNADPFAFNEQDFSTVADPNIRGWLRYFLGGGQLPS